ncbi:hypothetical protein NKH47_24475 [Mesorhizobium sp. M1060]|uniref:hypothetical protein n=1 Tax=Mesorhizobium sp. M1060 TaxID=2957052 RepID=UPI003339A9CC
MARNQPQKANQKTKIGAESAPTSRPTLRGVDRRTADGKRYAVILEGILVGLRGTPREEHLVLARRLAGIVRWCEGEEGRQAKGDAIDIGQYTSAINCIGRLYEALGIPTSKPPVDKDPFEW